MKLNVVFSSSCGSRNRISLDAKTVTNVFPLQKTKVSPLLFAHIKSLFEGFIETCLKVS